MIRILFSSVLAIHGIIHLMGFAKEWELAPKGKFSGKTLIPFSENGLKFIGILWLLTCILLMAATVAHYLRKDWFWIFATAGLILSQALIIIYWQDAKWGTIANIIILIAVFLSAAAFHFKKKVNGEVNDLVAAASGHSFSITDERVTKLPEIVQTWLRKSHVIGKESPTVIRITQQGTMRTNIQDSWMPFEAEQYFTIDPPGFVWTASIHTDSFVDIAGRDKFENGKGNMLIKAASLIPLANSRGNEIDQGTMVRYMAEITWFPHAVVSDYLHWEQLDTLHARVTMTYGDVSASGIYVFNSDGMPIGFEAERFGDFNGKYSRETWQVATTSYGYFNGILMGRTSEVTWKLKDGNFTWLRLEITDLNINRNQMKKYTLPVAAILLGFIGLTAH